MSEVAHKLRIMRQALAQCELGAIRLRGVDWFSWATGGGSSVVILTNEIGVAEVLVAEHGAWILTNAIEAERLRAEQVGSEWEIHSSPWQDPGALDRFVESQTRGRPIASDRPKRTESELPPQIIASKRRLLPVEIERYRLLGKEAAEAMTDVLQAARSAQTEWELAGDGAQALWARGIEPTLVLCAGEARIAHYRHPLPGKNKLGACAMLVFCGRRHGLYANLTRLVNFGSVSEQQVRALSDVAGIEAIAWANSAPGARLDRVYEALAQGYETTGHREEIDHHHQGGTTGYLSREVVASPSTATRIESGTALAWNPSLPAIKMEDTVLTTEKGIEILTVDRRWPTFTVEGRNRPRILERL